MQLLLQIFFKKEQFPLEMGAAIRWTEGDLKGKMRKGY